MNPEKGQENLVTSLNGYALAELDKIERLLQPDEEFITIARHIITNNFEPSSLTDAHLGWREGEVEYQGALDKAEKSLNEKKVGNAIKIVKAWGIIGFFTDSDGPLDGLSEKDIEQFKKVEVEEKEIERANAEISAKNIWGNKALISKLYEDGYYLLAMTFLKKQITRRNSSGFSNNQEFNDWAKGLFIRSLRRLVLTETYFDQIKPYDPDNTDMYGKDDDIPSGR